MDKLITFWVSDGSCSYKKIGECLLDESFHSADIKISITNKSVSNDN